MITRKSNAQIFLLTEFPWSLTVAWMSSYLTIFLVGEHLAARTIGWALGVGNVIQVVGLAYAGGLARRIGRKNSIMAGDFGGWVVVLALWALAKSPLLLALGLVLNQGSGFVGPAWNSLFSEGEDPRTLPRAFFILQVLGVLGGLVLPVIAPWVAERGVVFTGRWILRGLWPLVALSWLLRWLWLQESEAGRDALREKTPRRVVWRHLKEGFRGLGGVLALVRVLVQVPLLLFSTLAPLALVSRRGLAMPPSFLAWLPLPATAALGLLWLMRHQRFHMSRAQGISLSLALLLGGFGLLALAGPQEKWVGFVAWALVAAGQSEFWSSHTSYWMTWLSDTVRVDVQGWIGVMTAGMVAGLSPVVAPVMAQQPHPIFWVFTGIFAISLVVWSLASVFVPQAPRDSA
ncbi:MAG: MFS transporter [Firmicutes bacterium]|nr:MFS transporter [Bacillota bacterium]